MKHYNWSFDMIPEYYLLFEWDTLAPDEFDELANKSSIKKLRWLAMIHPDNKSRERLLRLSKIHVGENTIINIGINLYNNEPDSVEIGNRCAIGANASLIYESNPNMSLLNEIPGFTGKYCKKGRIVISDDVWIGANVIVFPGIILGARSIIGAGSVVTKDVPVNQIWAGNPAKMIRHLETKNES